MKYKNTRTGVIVDSPFSVSGGNWLPIDQVKNEEEEEAEEFELIDEKDKQVDASLNGMDDVTKDQIIQELESLGKEFNKRDKKEVLYNIMMED